MGTSHNPPMLTDRGVTKGAPADFSNALTHDTLLIDFNKPSDVDIANLWTATDIGSPVAEVLQVDAVSNGTYGALNAGSANSTGIQYGVPNSLPVAGATAANPANWGFISRLRVPILTGGTTAVGVCTTNGVLIDAAGAPTAVNNSFGFLIDTAGLIHVFGSSILGSDEQVSTGVSVVNDEVFDVALRAENWQVLGGNWSAGHVNAYVNGTLAHTFTPTSVPQTSHTSGFQLSMAAVNAAGGTVDPEIDYIGNWHTRYNK